MSEAEFRKNFGESLCALRKSRGITQIQLAQVLNYSDKAVSKWERGESVPDTYTICAIADFFCVSVDVLLGRKEDSGEGITAVPPPQENGKNKTSVRTYIALICMVSVFFVASIAFFALKNIATFEPYAWMCFIFALPIASIVLTVFSSLWWKIGYKCLCTSLLIWSIGITVYFSFMIENFKYIFIPCFIAQCICVLSYLLAYSALKKQK